MSVRLRNHQLVLVTILVAFAVYAAAFIWRTSFVIDGARYFSLFDDAMVSMRYARNLAHGFGLVWNPGGERVEGLTNPLWVLYMAGLHLLPLPESTISLPVQVTGAVAVAATLVVLASITKRLSQGSALAVATALGLTAFYLPLNTWALQGMEVGILTLWLSIAVWLAMDGLDSDSPRHLLYPWLALGTLIRLDAIVPSLVILGALVLLDGRHRRGYLVQGLGSLVLALGAQTVLRGWYYGQLLPNTYYLKMTGYPAAARVLRGAEVLGTFAVRTALGVLLLCPTLRFVPPDRRTALLGAVIIGQAAYSVYVGGDAWEWWGGSNRYLVIAMPLLFVLIGVSTGTMVRQAPTVRHLMVGVVALSVLTLNMTATASDWRAWLLLTPSLHVRDNMERVRAAHFIESITTPGATVAVVWAGAQPYFMHREAIDLLGKSDSVIAHRPMRLPPDTASFQAVGTFFWPGHLKWDYAYSIGLRRPDVVAQVWSDGRARVGHVPAGAVGHLFADASEARPYLEGSYRALVFRGDTLYARLDSPHIRWDRLPR